MPQPQAMGCGCVVAGYHGHGGKEYFDPSFSRPVEAGDMAGFARAVEVLLAAERERSGALEAIGRRAEAFVRENYSPQREDETSLTRGRRSGRSAGGRWWRGEAVEVCARCFTYRGTV